MSNSPRRPGEINGPLPDQVTELDMLTALINSSSDTIIFSLDREYRYTAFNDRHRDEMRRVWQADITIGTSLLDLMTIPELRESAKQSIDHALGGKPFMEVQHQPDPSVYYELSWTPIRLNGAVVGVTAFIRDITARVTAEQALQAEIVERTSSEARLKQSEFKYRTLYESMMDAFVRVEMTGEIVEFNQAYLKLIGYIAAEALQLSYTDITPERWHPSEAQIIAEQVMTQGYSDVYEKEYRRKDGTLVPIELRTNLITDAEGRPSGLWAIIRDVTERKQAEQDLQESESRFRRAVVDSPFPMLLHADDGAVVQANNAWCDITGYTHDELRSIGDWTERAYGERKESIQADIDALYGLNGRKAEGDYTIRTRNGSLRIWDFSSAGLGRLPDGRRLVLSTAMDVTERRAAEQEVQRLNAELEQRVMDRTAQLAAANKELEAFSYSVSHDLRAPLRAIDGFAHILTDDHSDQLTAEGRRTLEVIRTEAARMGHLIDDLLQFSRTNRQPMILAGLDLEAMAREVFDECAARAGSRTVQLHIDPLPMAVGDRPMIRQALVNLVSNAIKFTAPRAVATIHVDGRVEGPEVVYAIRDNGVGFDMRYAAKLFGVFQRLHSETEFEGTGVGLALVQRIIQRHGGRVWAEGTIDAGATFHFTLPRHEGHHEHAD